MTIEAHAPPAAAPPLPGDPRPLVSPGRRLLGSWEALLLVIGALIFVANATASPYFLDLNNLSDATFNFTEKAIVALAMAFVVIAGEIDLSVGGIIAIASTAMGRRRRPGRPRRNSSRSASASARSAACSTGFSSPGSGCPRSSRQSAR